MRRSIEFLLGLLDADETAQLAQEDWDGPHAVTIRLWQRLGFIDLEPGANPGAGCPHCGEGVPYRLDTRLLCPVCHSGVDAAQLLLWRVHLSVLLAWIAAQWRLRGDVRRIDDTLWQLGSGEFPEGVFECFYRKSWSLSERGKNRLLAYHQAIVMHGVPLVRKPEEIDHPHLLLSEWLTGEETLSLAGPTALVRSDRIVRFDESSGALYAGAERLGEVRPGTREYHLLVCLAAHLDTFVSYADLKRHVLLRSGGTDSTEEATFCHLLKNRIKKKGIPGIDQLLVTTNKGDGYRLRGVFQRSDRVTMSVLSC